MGDIVNLRLVRKRKAREASTGAADLNRVRSGISKREREAAAAERGMTTSRLDGHRLEPGPTIVPETPDEA